MSQLPRLYLITDRARAADGVGSVVDALRAALKAGVELVQFRDKNVPAERAWQLAREVGDLCREFGSPTWLVNSRADLAMDVQASGLHRPHGGIPVPAIRRLMGEEAWVGASAHGLDEALLAERAGADFVTLSPIFPTKSKPGYGPPLGPDAIREVTDVVDLPVFALAGITPERVQVCLEAGAHGVAVMGGIMAADDPAAKTSDYLNALQSTTRSPAQAGGTSAHENRGA